MILFHLTYYWSLDLVAFLKQIFKPVFGWTCSFWAPRRCLPATSCWNQKQTPRRPIYVCEVRKLRTRVVLCWTSAWLKDLSKCNKEREHLKNCLRELWLLVKFLEWHRNVLSWCNSRQCPSNKTTATSLNVSYAKTGMRTYHGSLCWNKASNLGVTEVSFLRKPWKKLFPWTSWYELAFFLAQETTNSYCGKLLTLVKQ